MVTTTNLAELETAMQQDENALFNNCVFYLIPYIVFMNAFIWLYVALLSRRPQTTAMTCLLIVSLVAVGGFPPFPMVFIKLKVLTIIFFSCGAIPLLVVTFNLVLLWLLLSRFIISLLSDLLTSEKTHGRQNGYSHR